MIRLLAGLLGLIAALSAGVARADPADITAAARSVVRVVIIQENGNRVTLVGHGSGFAVAPDLVVTNAHVVAPLIGEESMRVGIVPSQGETGWFARVLVYSPRNDLALLKLTEAGTLPPATLFTGALDDGTDVFAVGYPSNVDLAQGLSIGDIVSPTSPVKTRGYVSSGRSSKQFDTILHTAPIGMGNSGGPLLDSCGRVVGANSFGALSGGGESEFYFAVSVREIMRFLLAGGVKAQTTGIPCRSIAELDRAEAERLANEKAVSDEHARLAAERRDAGMRKAERQAQLQIIGQRENGMAIAGLAALLALASGGAALFYGQKKQRREKKIAAALAILLLLGAVAAWLTRPSLDDIDERARTMARAESPAPSPSPSQSAAAGKLVCVLDPGRSRVTVSPVTDVPLEWSEDGCVNGRSQYGLAADGWSRVLVPGSEDTVTVASFDPATRTYKTERYLLELDTMTRMRAERAKYTLPTCGGGQETARQLGESQAALKALLPPVPNERLVYECRPSE